MPNPGPGGWAVVILYHDGQREILKGKSPHSTNNRMELTAALHGIQKIPPEKRIILVTDSQYLKNGVEKWMEEWKSRNWKRKGGKLANVDLWKQLSEELSIRNVHWHWVRGHAGNHFNEMVDRLARAEMLSAE